MESSNISAVKDSHLKLLDDYSNAVDIEKNSLKFIQLFTEDAKFSIGNESISIGREQIRVACERKFTIVKQIERKCEKIYSISENKVMTEGTVIYHLLDGRILEPIPLCSIYELCPKTQLIEYYKGYIDLTPLYVALGYDITIDGKHEHPVRKRRNIES